MLVTAEGFTALLQTLGLSQGRFKPVPSLLVYGPANPEPAIDVINPFPHISNIPATNVSEYIYTHLPFSTDVNSTRALDKRNTPCQFNPYNAPVVEYQTFKPFDRTKANVFRYRQQQSVNLGSWFVQESWMMPSLFTCASGKQISELDIASGWGSTAAAQSVLERHWDTFIKQSDFQWLSSIGINTVRLPIGYWNLGPSFCQNTPFADVADVYRKSWPRIVRAINMAAEYDIGVLVDMHGAVGSQNGQPHSGISDGATGLFNSPSNTRQTLDALTFLMQNLANVTNVVGIQILNEPQNVPELADFYSTAIETMREVSPADSLFPLYLHDGFDLERFSNFVANRSDFVVQDHHSYFVFSASDDQEPATQHTGDISGAVAESLVKASGQQRRNLVVDEWSCALTADSLAHESDPDGARKAFCTGQMNVYANSTAGWCFWSYLKEGCETDPGWCFKHAVNNTLPATFYSYGQSRQMMNPLSLGSLAPNFSNMQLPSIPNILASAQRSSNAPKNAWDDFTPTSNNYAASSSSLPIAGFKRDASLELAKRDSFDGMDMAPTQRCIAKGYSDGFLTAKIFASYGISKLGFTGQYIEDSIWVLGPSVVAPGTEESYRQWFMHGLQDGESVIRDYLAAT